MVDERVESVKGLVVALLLLAGAFIWLVTNTERPLKPRELYALETQDQSTASTPTTA